MVATTHGTVSPPPSNGRCVRFGDSRRIARASLAIVIALVFLPSCKQNRCVAGFHEENAECVSDAPVDAGCAVATGLWGGTTNLSLPVRFTVAIDTASITGAHLEANISTSAGVKRIVADSSSATAVVACRFTASVGSGQIVASFADAGSASGSWTQSTSINETVYSASGTWLAAPCAAIDAAACVADVVDAGLGGDGGLTTDAGGAVDAGATAIGITTVAGFTATTFAEGLVGPSAVAVDGQGRLYVAEYTLDRVVRFNPDGGGRVVIADRDGGVVRPLGLAVGSGDAVFVACSGRIVTISASGAVSVFRDATGFEGAGIVAVEPDILYASEASFGAAGTRVFRLSPDGGAVVVATGFTSPFGLAPFGSGLLLVAEADFGFANADGVLFYELSTDGGVTNLAPIPLVASPGALALRPDGGSTFAVAETDLVTGDPARVFLYNRTTNTTSELANGFQVPMGLAFRAATRLYVTEFARGRVVLLQGSF